MVPHCQKYNDLPENRCTNYITNLYTHIISFGMVLHHGVLFCGHLPTRNAVHYREIYPVLVVKRQRERVYTNPGAGPVSTSKYKSEYLKKNDDPTLICQSGIPCFNKQVEIVGPFFKHKWGATWKTF